MKECVSTKKVIVIVFSIIILALLLRGMFFLKYLHSFELEGDAANYRLMSQQLVEKGIFGYWYNGNKFGGSPGVSNARVTPGYPLFLSSIYAVVRDPYLQITITRLIQVIIGGLFTPLFAFLFVRRAIKRNDVAILTTLFVAIYPTYIQSTIHILTEVLSLSTMLLYFYIMTLGFQKRKIYLNILAGGVFAVHILIRPGMLPLFIVPFIFAFLESKKTERKTIIKFFIQTIIGFCAVMLPWWIRNVVVLHQFIITAIGSGNPLLAGTYPFAKSGMPNYMNDVPDRIRGISKLQAEFAKERIIAGFTSEPLLYFRWYTIGKLQYMFERPWLYYMTLQTQIFHTIIHSLIIWIGLLGVVVNSIKSKLYRYINIYALIFLAIYLAFDPQPRYIYQHMFFLMLAAAIFLCYCSEKIMLFYRKNLSKIQ